MGNDMTQEEFFQRRDELLNRFKKKYHHKIITVPLFRNVFYYLLHGKDEIAIIEELIEMIDQNHELMQQILDRQELKIIVSKNKN